VPPETAYARFGLAGNPYLPKATDCLREQRDHERLLFELTGFSTVAQAREAIAEGARSGETRFLLITGADGSGRTSIANCSLDLYRQARGIAHGKFLVPKLQENEKVLLDRNASVVYKNWLSLLRQAVQDRDLELGDQLDATLKAAGDQLGAKGWKTEAVEASGALKRLAKVLTAQQAGLALIVERVLTMEHILAAFDLFRDVPALCVFTAAALSTDEGRTIRTAFATGNPTRCIHVDLGTLTGADVERLAVHRWALAKPGEPSPWILPVIGDWFDQATDVTVGRALFLLKEVFALKVGQERDLAFTETELRNWMTQASQWRPAS
jgi:hypothetical protein